VEILGYATTAWKWEQDAEGCPEHLIGTKQEFCWRYLKVFERVIGHDRIRHILGYEQRQDITSEREDTHHTADESQASQRKNVL
jgi:hypothetical protein